MHWIPATAAVALAYAAMLVLVRRRWGTERMLVAAFLGALVVLAAAIGLALMSGGDPDLAGLVVFALVVATAGGAVATAWTVEHMVRDTRVPDPLVETMAGAGAFVGGALAGGIALVFLIGLGMPRIG